MKCVWKILGQHPNWATFNNENGMLKCNHYMLDVNLKYKQINSQWIHIILKDFFTL